MPQGRIYKAIIKQLESCKIYPSVLWRQGNYTKTSISNIYNTIGAKLFHNSTYVVSKTSILSLLRTSDM